MIRLLAAASLIAAAFASIQPAVATRALDTPTVTQGAFRIELYAHDRLTFARDCGSQSAIVRFPARHVVQAVCE